MFLCQSENHPCLEHSHLLARASRSTARQNYMSLLAVDPMLPQREAWLGWEVLPLSAADGARIIVVY